MTSAISTGSGGTTVLIELAEAATSSLSNPHRREVSDVNWRICAGDFWVVGALPGSGKSGLLSTAAGMLRPLEGRSRYFGRDLEQLDEDEFVRLRRNIGLVFEDGGRLFSHLTVAENVALPLCYHRDCSAGEAAAAVQPLLDRMELSSIARRTPGRINRSWRQRVALARALALQPAVLLLDNPLAGLDPRQTGWWLEFLAALAGGHECLQGRPLTLAVSCEDLRPWIDCGTRFALIKEARWLAVGGKADVARSDEPLVRDLLMRTGSG